jgi:hypothetical protein
MSTATLSAPVDARQLSPIVSKTELLAAIAAGTVSVDEGMKRLKAFDEAERANRPQPRVMARRTAKGGIWISLGYRAEPGLQNAATLPLKGWQAVVKLVQDGTIPELLANVPSIPLSATAKGGA